MTGPTSRSWHCLMGLMRLSPSNSTPHLNQLTECSSTEDFSYFTLRQKADPPNQPHASSLFGISCTRQLVSSQLIDRPSDVTRSTVQKAVVVIADSPQAFGQVRERLGMVTKAWFQQRNFDDVEILKVRHQLAQHMSLRHK